MLVRTFATAFMLTLASLGQTAEIEVPSSSQGRYLPSHIERNPENSKEALAWLRHLSPERFSEWSESRLKTATALDLSSLNLNNEDLVYLRSVPKLRQLDLSHTPITNGGLAHLKVITTLRELDLGSTTISSVAPLASLPLTHLDLSQTHMDNAAMQDLYTITSLTHLNLFGTGVNNDGLTPFVRYKRKGLDELTNLQALNLGQTTASQGVFAPLAKIPGLRELTVDQISISTPEEFDFYYRFATEKDLKLNYYGRLSIRYNPAWKDKLMLLRNVEGLEYLSLHGKLPDNFAKFLLPMKSLKRLGLNRCAIKDGCVEDLKQLKSLVYLDIFMHQLSKEKLEELRNALPNLKTLK